MKTTVHRAPIDGDSGSGSPPTNKNNKEKQKNKSNLPFQYGDQRVRLKLLMGKKLIIYLQISICLFKVN